MINCQLIIVDVTSIERNIRFDDKGLQLGIFNNLGSYEMRITGSNPNLSPTLLVDTLFQIRYILSRKLCLFSPIFLISSKRKGRRHGRPFY